MAGIKFDITGDNQHFINAMNGVQNSVRQTAAMVESSGVSIEDMFNRIAGAAGIAFSAATMNTFVDKVKETRKYFQDIESTMEVFLGNQQKAAEFTQKLQKYAYYNMFEFSELAMASKQMIAYHTAVEDVIPELDKLSNIATGTKQPLMDLVSMYNNARNVGYIASQQLAGWARQGILVKDTLKEMGQEVKKGGVTFEQLQMVIDKYTGEGGMFHNLMANQMENISAEEGQLADTLDLMYNEIGKKYQDTIVKGYKAITETVEAFPETMGGVLDVVAGGADFIIDHYKAIGTTLVRLITIYGAYKAALIATNASQTALGNAKYREEAKALEEQIGILTSLKTAKDDIVSQDLLEYTAAGKLTEESAKQLELEREKLALRVGKGELTVEQANNLSEMQTRLALLNQEHDITLKTADDKIAALKEEKAFYEEAIPLFQQEANEKQEALDLGKKKLADAKEHVDITQAMLEKEQQIAAITGQEVDSRVKDEAEDALETYDQLKDAIDIEALSVEAETAATQVNTAAEKINTIQNEINTVAEERHAMVTTADTVAIEGNTLATRIHTAASKAGAQVMLIFNAAVLQVKNAFTALKTAIMTNPLGILIGAITIALPMLMDFFGAEEDGAEKTKKFGESADEATNSVKTLYSVLDSAKAGSKTSNDAMEELIRSYNDYGIKLDETIMKGDDEIAKIDEVKAHREELIKVIKQEAIERQAANDISSTTEDYESGITETKNEIKEAIGDGWSNEAKNQLVDNFITDEFIKEITQKMNHYKDVLNEMKKTYGAQAYATRQAQEAWQEYQDALGKADKQVEAMGNSLGLTTDDINDAKEAIHDNADELIEHRNELNEGVEAANAARDAALRASYTLDDNTTKLRLNKMNLADIKSFLEDIAKRNKIDIDINVRYNEENPMPEALKKLTSKQWQKRSAEYARIADQMKGDTAVVKDVWTGESKKMTKQQVMEESARAANQSESTRKSEEAAKKAAEKAAEEDKKNRKKSANAAAKRTKEEADRQAKEKQQAWKHQEEMEKLEDDAARAREDASIAAIQSQAQRERAEREAQYNRTIADLKRQEDEIYKKIYEQRKQVYETQHKNDKNGGHYELTAEGAAGYLTDSAKKAIRKSLKGDELKLYKEETSRINSEIAVEEAKQVREQIENEKKLIESHLSYTDKKIKIDKDYSKEAKNIDEAIADAEKRGDKDTVEALKRSRAELEKERAKSQADLSLQQLQESPEYIRAFEDLDNTSTETLEHLIQMFEDAKKSAGRNLDPQDLKAYTDAIRQMQDKVRERDPFKALAESAKKLKKANGDVEKAEKDLENVRKGGFRMMTVYNKETKEYEQKVMSVADAEENLRKAKDKQKETQAEYSKSLEETLEIVSRLGSSISELGNTIGGTAGAILSLTGEVFSFVNNTITSINGLNNMQKGLAKTIETASVVLMVISTAFQLFQKVSSLFGESEEEKRLRKERIKFYEEMTFKVAEYRKQVLLAEQAEKEWFSTTDLQKLTDQWQVSQQAVKDYKKAIEDVRDTYYKSIKGSSLFDFLAGGDIYEKWKKWSNFGEDIPLDFVMNVNGTPDTLSHFVKETYGEALYGEDGLLNIDLAKSVLNDYGDMLVGDGKEILEGLVAQLEEYNKWVESLREYVSNLYSPFADNMVDSLWEWYENGTDVMDAFGDKARDTFKSVSQEMMKQLVNSVVFDKLKERLTSAYEQYAIAINNGTDQKQALYSLTDTLENVMSLFEQETKDAIPVLQTYMQRLGTMVGESFGGGMADSFDEMRDSFRSALLDMESDTDNFAKNIKQNIFEALVDNFYMEQMKDDINELAKAYDAVTKARYVDKNGNTYANDPREVLQTEVELLRERQQSLTKNSAEWREVTEKIIDYNKQIAAFEGLEEISDEERQRRIDDLNAEANAIIKVGEEAVKTYAAMTGWDIEQKIDASPFANLSDDMLSVLQDTSKSVDEWKDEIVKMMTDDLVKELVYNDEYKAKMREFQLQYVAIFENDALSTEQKQAQLDSLATSMAEYANKQADAVKDIVKANEELESSFGDLHDTFMDAITDMENGAEDLKTKLNETLIKDLIEKKAFEVPITVTIDGEEKVFDNFDKYQEDWTRRYLDALDNYKETGDETTLNLLVDELTKREEAMAELTKDYVERLQKAAKDTTFTDMESSLVSALMNMNGDITDFANDMKKTIVQKLIESFMVSEQIKPMLEEIQRAFNYAMSQGMTSEQRAAFFKNGGLFTDETGTFDFKGIDSYNDKLTSMYDATSDLLTAIGYDFGEVETLFSKLGDTIVSSLMKTENGVEDFMTSITETIVNDLVKSYIASDELQERLTGIKDGLEAAAKAVAEAKTDEEIAKANEQLKEAKKNAEDFYNEVEAGTKRFTDLLNTVENDTTFSGLGKSFISSLTDMSKTAEDWAHDVGRTMAERIFEGILEARNTQGIFDNIQKVFNEAVAANTDENGNIDWQKVVNTPALTETVNDSKKDFTELQTAWETLCESLGISLKELPLSDLGSTIMDSLTDLEDNADDFGKRISLTLMQGMLEELFNERYTEKLNEIREHWQKALAGEDGYTIDSVKKEIVDLRNELDNLSEDDPLKGLTDGIKELSKEVEEADKTFSDMADSFVGNLLDMESTAKDLGNSIGQTLIEKIVKALIVDKELQKFLDDIQEAFDTAIADPNATIDSVLDAVVPKIDAAVEATEKWEDVTKALAERYKQIEESTPFDDLRSKFRSSLMNMSEDVNAFSNDLTDAITEAFIDSFVLGTAFDDALDGWRERYGKIMGAEGLSEEERARQLKLLQSDIVEAKEGYIEQARNIQDLLGYGIYQDQDATMNMADKATYDQFETYLGIAVAQQITGEQQLGIQQQILATLQGMSGLGTQTNDAMLTQTMLANAHLELIRDYSKTIRDEVLLHLASMDSKLSHLTNI